MDNQVKRPPAPPQWLSKSLALANAIGAHDFDLRAWRLLDFVRRQTYEIGRPAVYIERLDTFSSALDVSRGNVSRILKELKAQLVIEERPQYCYSFREPVQDWKVALRLKLFEVSDQLTLIEPPPHIRDAMRIMFGGEGIPGTEPGRPSTAAPNAAVSQTTVSESGTVVDFHPFPNRERSQKPNNDGPSEPVPDSGTAHVTCNMQQCSNVLSTEHSYIVTCPVPESGTQEGTQAVSQEEQDLLNWLQSVGAFTDKRGDPSRACWLGMVRKRPRVVAELKGEFTYVSMTRSIRNPGAWMMDKWKRWGKPDE